MDGRLTICGQNMQRIATLSRDWRTWARLTPPAPTRVDAQTPAGKPNNLKNNVRDAPEIDFTAPETFPNAFSSFKIEKHQLISLQGN
jgi:hypothetical protein